MFSIISGELKNRKHEAEYLADAWPRDARLIRTVLGISALGVAAMLVTSSHDPRIAEIVPRLVAAQFVQLAAICFAFGATFVAARPGWFALLILVAELTALFSEAQNYAIAYAPLREGGAVDMPFMVLLVFVFYTLLPNRFAYTLFVGIFTMVVYGVIGWVSFGHSVPVVSYLIMMFMFVNILGIGYGGYINRLQRTDYLRRIELEEEIHQRKRAEVEAIEAREAAEVANRHKSKLLAVAGHDLRQPMHALGLWVDTLEERLKSGQTEAAWEVLSRMHRARTGLNDLLGRLLHISHLDAGVTDVKLEPVDLAATFTELRRQFSDSADKRDLQLRILDTSVVVESDRVLLDRVLANLVDNAIKYADAGGRVAVGVRRQADRVRIEVWNTGPGIPASDLSDIFNEFHQVEQGSEDVRGLGLGLSIVKRLATLLGHRVSVESIPGRLTCFALLVPRSETSHAEPVADTAPGTFDLQVLVIDDDAEVRDALATVLTRWGCEVNACSGPVSAHEALDDFSPQLIITDQQLKNGANGIELAHDLTARMDSPCPVLLSSGDTTTEGIQRAAASGFRVLAKPVNPAHLRIVIHQLMSAAV